MNSLKLKLSNTFAQLFIDHQPSTAVYMLMHSFAALHAIACITYQHSALHSFVSWSDPSFYINSALLVYIGVAFTLFYILIVVIKFSTAQQV